MSIQFNEISDELYETLTGHRAADVARRLAIGPGHCAWRDDLWCDTECGQYAGCVNNRQPIAELTP